MIETGKRKRINGEWRTEVASVIKRMYVDEGMSIRSIAEALQHSYGFVHRVLVESGVELASPGGARQGGGGSYSKRIKPRELSPHEAREYAERMREHKIK